AFRVNLRHWLYDDGRLIHCLQILKRRVDILVLEAAHGNEAIAIAILDVGVLVVEDRQAQAAQVRGTGREWTYRRADLNRLLVVHFRLRVALAVVVPDVDLAVVIREVRVERHARVGRAQEALALGKDRALEPVAVNALLEIDPWCLLDAEAHP